VYFAQVVRLHPHAILPKRVQGHYLQNALFIYGITRVLRKHGRAGMTQLVLPIIHLQPLVYSRKGKSNVLVKLLEPCLPLTQMAIRREISYDTGKDREV
jgi:hypothetical protein